MDGIAVMRALLLAHAPLVSLVGARVIAGTVPAGTPLPAVGIKEVGRNEMDTVARKNPGALVTMRVQITIYAAKYPELKSVLRAARLGPGVFTGEIAGVNVRSVLRDAVGPDMSDEEPGIQEQSRDYKITYIEPE